MRGTFSKSINAKMHGEKSSTVANTNQDLSTAKHNSCQYSSHMQACKCTDLVTLVANTDFGDIGIWKLHHHLLWDQTASIKMTKMFHRNYCNFGNTVAVITSPILLWQDDMGSGCTLHCTNVPIIQPQSL